MARRTFGSVRQLPSGRWQARYRLADDWVNAPATFDTKAAGADWLITVQADMIKGTWVDRRRIGTVAAIVEDFIDSRSRDDKPLSPRTRSTYLDSLARCIDGTRLGRMAAADVRPSDIRTWWTGTLEAHPLPQAKKAYRVLRAAFNRLVADDVIPANPCRIKSAGSSIPARTRVASEEEIARILEHLPARWHALVLLGAWVGPRWGELRGLTRGSIDLDTGTVLIEDQLDERGVRRPTKTGDSGVVHIPPHLIDELRAHLDTWVRPGSDALVFTGFKGNALSQSLFGKHWRAAQDQAGVERLQVHDLRRTAGTWATEKGGASLATVMRRLRHKTVAAAMVYQRPGAAEDRAVAERLSAASAYRTAQGA